MARVVKIDSKGNNTPEYRAVLNVAIQISSALEAEETAFVRNVHRSGIIPSSNLRGGEDVMDKVLAEVSRDPLIYYAFQYVLHKRNAGDRYSDCIRRMEKKFLGEFYYYINCLRHTYRVKVTVLVST